MSVRATSWVWEHSRSKGAARLVLLALADHAGADGGDAWPSIARLMERCQVGESTVREAIHQLEALEELEVDRQAGPRGVNRYRLTFRGGEGGQNPGGQNPAPTGPRSGPPPLQDSAPTPPESGPVTVIEPPREPSMEPDPPSPPPSGGGLEHRGQHAACRACGTSRRGPRTPTPEEQTVAAMRARCPDVADLDALPGFDADVGRAGIAAARKAKATALGVPPPAAEHG